MFTINNPDIPFINQSGVYYIQNNINKKKYIGSSFNIEQRLNKHWTVLRGNRHKNKDFQNDFNINNGFTCGILYICDKHELLVSEHIFIDQIDNLYNKNNQYRMIDIEDIDPNYLYSKCTKDGILGCWNLISTSKVGYGQCSINNKKYTAHRLSYFLNNPKDNQQQLICHSCNNKRCINPEHLYAGSFQDNAKDNGPVYLNFIYCNLIRNIVYNNKNKTRVEILDLINNYYESNINIQTFYNIINNKIMFDKSWTCPILNRDLKKLSNLNWEIVKYIRSLDDKPSKILQKVMLKYNLNTTYGTIMRILLNKRWYDPNYTVFNKNIKWKNLLNNEE